MPTNHSIYSGQQYLQYLIVNKNVVHNTEIGHVNCMNILLTEFLITVCQTDQHQILRIWKDSGQVQILSVPTQFMVRFLEALLHHLGLLLSHTPQESPMTSRSALCLYHCLSTLHPWTVHFTYYPKTEDRHSLKYFNIYYTKDHLYSFDLQGAVHFLSAQLNWAGLQIYWYFREQSHQLFKAEILAAFNALSSSMQLQLDEPSTKLCRRTF